MTIANVEMAAAWDGAEGDHWAAHADRYEAIGPGYWQALLRAVPIRSDQTIVDIGCGTGGSTRDLARMVPSGSVLGVDLSAKMLNRARLRAEGRVVRAAPWRPGGDRRRAEVEARRAAMLG
jgi:trans-aconitate methyltransferase